MPNTGAKKTSIQGHQVSVCRQSWGPPEGTANQSQLGKSGWEGAKQDARQAAACASECSSWEDTSQPSPPAVQHHALLLTRTRYTQHHNNEPSEQSAAAKPMSSAAADVFLEFMSHWLMSESPHTWGRRRLNVHSSDWQLCFSRESVFHYQFIFHGSRKRLQTAEFSNPKDSVLTKKTPLLYCWFTPEMIPERKTGAVCDIILNTTSS